jgi:hypothetical protein
MSRPKKRKKRVTMRKDIEISPIGKKKLKTTVLRNRHKKLSRQYRKLSARIDRTPEQQKRTFEHREVVRRFNEMTEELMSLEDEMIHEKIAIRQPVFKEEKRRRRRREPQPPPVEELNKDRYNKTLYEGKYVDIKRMQEQIIEQARGKKENAMEMLRQDELHVNDPVRSEMTRQRIMKLTSTMGPWNTSLQTRDVMRSPEWEFTLKNRKPDSNVLETTPVWLRRSKIGVVGVGFSGPVLGERVPVYDKSTEAWVDHMPSNFIFFFFYFS